MSVAASAADQPVEAQFRAQTGRKRSRWDRGKISSAPNAEGACDVSYGDSDFEALRAPQMGNLPASASGGKRKRVANEPPAAAAAPPRSAVHGEGSASERFIAETSDPANSIDAAHVTAILDAKAEKEAAREAARQAKAAKQEAKAAARESKAAARESKAAEREAKAAERDRKRRLARATDEERALQRAAREAEKQARMAGFYTVQAAAPEAREAREWVQCDRYRGAPTTHDLADGTRMGPPPISQMALGWPPPIVTHRP